MNEKHFYLKQNVIAEPLVNQWYAWSYLISPPSSAMFLANLQIKIMESYISSPITHQEALKKEDLQAGPFINYETNKVDKIKELLSFTQCSLNHMMEFADAIIKLNELLKNEANGLSLEDLYIKIPSHLKGYVELVYDLNNNPSFRFLEPLLYNSKYYLSSLQGVMLYEINQDYRPFCLNTPKLLEQEDVYIKLPYNDKLYDKLFSMKESPKTICELEEIYLEFHKNSNISKNSFMSLFTTSSGKKPNNYTEAGIRIRYFGHACLLIESNNTSILIDPVISYSYSSDIERYTYLDLPNKIDWLLITHAHQDHLLIEHLLQLRYKVKNVIVPRSNSGALQDPSLKLLFQSLGFNNIIEMDILDKVMIPGGEIIGIPFFGEHGDLDIQTKIAYLFRINNVSILSIADSNNFSPLTYEYIKNLLGEIDILFVGMECDGAPLTWLYGPLLTSPLTRKMDTTRRLNGSNYEKALKLIECFNCKQVYIYAMGQEPWLTYLMNNKYTNESKPIIDSNLLISTCEQRGIKAETLFGKKEMIILPE